MDDYLRGLETAREILVMSSRELGLAKIVREIHRERVRIRDQLARMKREDDARQARPVLPLTGERSSGHVPPEVLRG